MGIFITCCSLCYSSINTEYCLDITTIRANYIRTAIEGYVARIGFMPYASDENGVEIVGKTNGFVPYKTLGIPKKYIHDGWNKRFRYIMCEALAAKKYTEMEREIYPIQIPLNWTPSMARYHFLRLYRYSISENRANLYKDKMKLIDLDNASKLEQNFYWNIRFVAEKGKNVFDYIPSHYIIKLKQNKEEIKLDTTWIHNAFIHPNRNKKEERWPINDITKYDTEYQDIFAYVLVSEPRVIFQTNQYEIEYYENGQRKLCKTNGIGYWQSRFNIASNVGAPATPESMDYEGNIAV
jgi:hypothetical protein